MQPGLCRDESLAWLASPYTGNVRHVDRRPVHLLSAGCFRTAGFADSRYFYYKGESGFGSCYRSEILAQKDPSAPSSRIIQFSDSWPSDSMGTIALSDFSLFYLDIFKKILAWELGKR
jgi:hypothetical protein